MAESVIWGIHAGKTGDAQALFLDEGCVALGWPAVGDLSRLASKREAVKDRVARVFPGMTTGQVPVAAGQLFRFAHEMKPGDLVVYPMKSDRSVRLGRVIGPYFFDVSSTPAYPHRRSVEWLKTLPRKAFSQAALYEIGSALSLFQVKNYAEEFRGALQGVAPTLTDDEDESVAIVVQETAQSTEDFILKRLARDLKGHAFEHFIAHLLECMGFRTRVTQKSGDGGVDIIAHRDALGFEPPIIKVQVKSKEGSIGEPEVKQLKGTLAQGEKGLLVTLGSITPKADLFARTVPDIRLIDGVGLVALVLEHYEKFDSKYRAAIPLKRMYLPAPLGDEAEG